MSRISKRFNMFGFIIVLIVALGLFIQFSNFNKVQLKQTQIITSLSRDAAGSEISSQLMEKAQIISTLADYVAIKSWNDDELVDYFRILTKNNTAFSMIYLGKPNNVIINGSDWIPPKSFDLRIRPWYIKAIAEDRLIFSEVFANAAKEELIVTIAKPVYSSKGEFLGVVAGDVSIENILSIVQDNEMSGNEYSFIIDGKGNILAHPHYGYGFSSDIKNIDEISKVANSEMHQNMKGMTKITLDGIEGFLAYQPIANTDWRIGSFVSLNEYMESKLQYLWIYIITFITSILVFVILILLERKYFLNPIIAFDCDIQEINIEKDITFRVPVINKDPFVSLRKSINSALDKTQEFFSKLEADEEELIANNNELEASYQQLAAAEEELWNHNEQLKKSQSDLKASEETFRTLFEGSSDPILLMEGTIFIYCNSAATELFGYTSINSIIGKGLCELSPEKQLDGMLSREKEIEINKAAQEKGKLKFEWWLQKIDGTLFPVEVMLTPIVLDGKEVFHVLWRDISERKQMEQKLEYLSYHDQLTGLYNRRFFVEELERLDVKRNYPLTIIMADVNGLKLINDSFGHSKGDELLVKTAEVIKKGCRADDIISRVGGDEFVMLLPKTDTLEAERIVKRIKSICKNERVASLEFSISFGWEAKLNEDEDVGEVFRKAEDYLYKKKLFESPSMRGKTIDAIISTLHEKNKREEQHSHRVSTLCESMGKALGLSEDKVQEMKTVGLLHDIGKIAIDENILNKPGKLTEEEREEIKKHPEIGYRILSSVNDMSEMAVYVLAHHERWDGGGYPKGLREKEIPIQARIIAIADAYDAMTSDRPYRSPLTVEVAIEELENNAGTQFDSKLVKVFIENIENVN